MSHWPILRTDPRAAAGKEVGIAFFCAFWTWLGVAGIGVILSLIIWGLNLASLPVPMNGFGGAAMLLLYSPFISWAGFIPAIPVSIWALRNGWAGWFTALIAGALVGGLVFTLIARGSLEGFLVGMPFGAGFSALFWCLARLKYRDVFVAR